MVPPPAGGATARCTAGEAADQPEALGQGRRTCGLALQQRQASLDDLGLAESEGLAQAVESGFAAVKRRTKIVRIAFIWLLEGSQATC